MPGTGKLRMRLLALLRLGRTADALAPIASTIDGARNASHRRLHQNLSVTADDTRRDSARSRFRRSTNYCTIAGPRAFSGLPNQCGHDLTGGNPRRFDTPFSFFAPSYGMPFRFFTLWSDIPFGFFMPSYEMPF